MAEKGRHTYQPNVENMGRFKALRVRVAAFLGRRATADVRANVAAQDVAAHRAHDGAVLRTDEHDTLPAGAVLGANGWEPIPTDLARTERRAAHSALLGRVAGDASRVSAIFGAPNRHGVTDPTPDSGTSVGNSVQPDTVKAHIVSDEFADEGTGPVWNGVIGRPRGAASQHGSEAWRQGDTLGEVLQADVAATHELPDAEAIGVPPAAVQDRPVVFEQGVLGRR
jgi:hypothetical protein